MNRLANAGLRSLPNRCDRVLEDDEAVLHRFVRCLADLADVRSVVWVKGIERGGTERLKRAEQEAEARSRIDTCIRRYGYGELRNTNSAECIAEAIPRDDYRRTKRHHAEARGNRWSDILCNPAHQVVGGRVGDEVIRYAAETLLFTALST